mmetsp:Transcript_10449/g.33388  ORF Transcript_10449/g.33388 Transcript_10449/m.33388 type:complete len:318 (-) Transcript_10449:194-1147(-)
MGWLDWARRCGAAVLQVVHSGWKRTERERTARGRPRQVGGLGGGGERRKGTGRRGNDAMEWLNARRLVVRVQSKRSVYGTQGSDLDEGPFEELERLVLGHERLAAVLEDPLALLDDIDGCAGGLPREARVSGHGGQGLHDDALALPVEDRLGEAHELAQAWQAVLAGALALLLVEAVSAGAAGLVVASLAVVAALARADGGSGEAGGRVGRVHLGGVVGDRDLGVVVVGAGRAVGHIGGRGARRVGQGERGDVDGGAPLARVVTLPRVWRARGVGVCGLAFVAAGGCGLEQASGLQGCGRELYLGREHRGAGEEVVG